MINIQVNKLRYYINGKLQSLFSWLLVLNSPLKGLKLEVYFGKIKHGTPYFLPRKLKNKKFVQTKWFGINTTSLGWKTKFNEYRFEWSPSFSLVILNRQLMIWVVPKVNCHIDIYWEAWLNYYYTDKTLSVEERCIKMFEKYSCTWKSYNKNKEWVSIDYYPYILKDKYIKLYEQWLKQYM